MSIVNILAFGPLAEILGWKEKTISIPSPTTPFLVVEFLDLEDWAGAGLTYYLNNEMCDAHIILPEKCELALLPPVSGG